MRTLLLALLCIWPASGFAALKIERAYRGESSGHLLVVVAPDASEPRLASGNRVFWGDSKRVAQLEGELEGPEGEIQLSAQAASISCSQNETLTRVEDIELAAISKRLTLQFLPGTLESQYLFQSRETGDYVFVQAPIFNFHGDYRVSVGKLGSLRQVPVAETAATWRQTQPGKISFKSGGGLYIPMLIALFADPVPRQRRGSPTLLRSAGGELEALVVPKLSRKTLLRLGFGKEGTERGTSPCASVTGATLTAR